MVQPREAEPEPEGLSPAMAAGLSDMLWSVADIANLVKAARLRLGRNVDRIRSEPRPSTGDSMRYGTFYALTDFFDRLVPKAGAPNGLLLKSVMDGVKRIAIVQNNNPWVTINPTVTAGLWIYYQDRRRWLINPGQEHIRLETAYGSLSGDPDIEVFLRPGLESGQIADTGRQEFKQWRVAIGSLYLVWKFLESLDRPTDADIVGDNLIQHPRYFPAEVRVMALEMFKRDGRMCPGVKGRSKQHKLTAESQIEFDHILPFAEGGPSTYRNVQVLCTACNRLKGATAA